MGSTGRSWLRHLPDFNASYIFNAMLSSSRVPTVGPASSPRDERPSLTDELLDELSRWGPRERGGMFRSWHRGALSIVHLIVLTVLEADGPRSMGDLAEALDVSVASATGIVDRMERRGLVERIRDADDRRVIMVSLTPTGSVVFADMRAKRRERLSSLVERLSDSERAGFLVGLRAMRIAAEEIHGSADQAAHGPIPPAEQRTSAR